MNTETAYRACEEITRREAKNFGYGIRLLRVPERHALSSVYALARRIDDIGDGTAPPAQKMIELAQVRESVYSIDLDREDPVLVAVAAAARNYGLPLGAFDDLIGGCENDVTGTSYGTFDDLVAFECARVHEWFERGLQLLPLLDRRSRACVGAMSGIYYRLLVHIERDPMAVTMRRLSLPAAEKVWIAGKCIVGAQR
jgi:phytoene/squalene synthetase